MRFSWKCPSYADSFMWHIWYAWRPIRTIPMGEGFREFVWLDTVLRRRSTYRDGWEYTTNP